MTEEDGGGELPSVDHVPLEVWLHCYVVLVLSLPYFMLDSPDYVVCHSYLFYNHVSTSKIVKIYKRDWTLDSLLKIGPSGLRELSQN